MHLVEKKVIKNGHEKENSLLKWFQTFNLTSVDLKLHSS